MKKQLSISSQYTKPDSAGSQEAVSQSFERAEKKPGFLQRIRESVHTKFLRWGLGVSMLAAAACSTEQQQNQSDTNDAGISDVTPGPDAQNSDGGFHPEIRIGDSNTSDINNDVSVDSEIEAGPALAGGAPWPDADFWPLQKLENGNTLFENFPPEYVDPVSNIDQAARIAWEVPADMMPMEGATSAPLLTPAAGIEAILNNSNIFDHSEPGLRWTLVEDFDNNGEDDLMIHGYPKVPYKRIPYISYQFDGAFQPLEPTPWLKDQDVHEGECLFAGNLDNDPKARVDVICSVEPEFTPEYWTPSDGRYRSLSAYYGTFQGPTPFWKQELYNGHEDLRTLTAHDLNGDGFPDIAAANFIGKFNNHGVKDSGENFRIYKSDANPVNANGDKQIMTYSMLDINPGVSEASFGLGPSATNIYQPIHTDGSLPTLLHFTDNAEPQKTFVFTPQSDGSISMESFYPFFNPKFDNLSFLHILSTAMGELCLGDISKPQLEEFIRLMKETFLKIDVGEQAIGFANGGESDPMLHYIADILGHLHLMQSHTGSFVPGVTTVYVDPGTGEYLHNQRLNFDTILTSDGGPVTCWTGTEIPHGGNHTAFLTSCGDESDGMSAGTDTSLQYILNYLEAPVDDQFIPNFGTGSLRVDVLGPDLTFHQTAAAWRAVENPDTKLAEVKWVEGTDISEDGEYFDATSFNYNGDVYVIASLYQDPDGENGYKVFKVNQRGQRFWLAFDVQNLPGVPQDGRGAVVKVVANEADIVRRAVIGASTRINAGNSYNGTTFFAMGDADTPVETVDVEVCWPGGQVEPSCEAFLDIPVEQVTYGTNPDEEHGPNNPYVIKK